MKKLIILFFFLFSFVKINAHVWQLVYCIDCFGNLTLYVESNHPNLTLSTNQFFLNLTVNGVTTAVTGNLTGQLNNVTFAQLPNCSAAPISFASCTAANTLNNWYVFSFPFITNGDVVQFQVTGGTGADFQDACGMYPATSNTFTVTAAGLEPIIMSDISFCEGGTNNIVTFPTPPTPGSSYFWSNTTNTTGIPANGNGDINFTPNTSPTVLTDSINLWYLCSDTITFAVDLIPNSTAPNKDTIICGGSFTVPSGDETYSVSGIYKDTILNALSCDSLLTFNLTITNPSTSTATQAACGNYTWIDGNTYNTSNNTATHILTNSVGCDSTITLDLTINSPTSSTDTQISCGSYTWTDGNTYTTSNNIASQTLINSVGCDSTITLNLTVNQPSSSIDTQTSCGSYTWIDGNIYNTSNNIATHIIPNSSGCDSTITLNLIVNQPSFSMDTQTSCGSFTWIDGNTYNASNNTATHTLSNSVGCDSIITLDLTINKKPLANFNFNDQCLYDTVHFTNTSTVNSPDNISNWSWDINGNGVENYSTQNVNHKYISAEVYLVTLIVETDNNCTDTITQSVNLFPVPQANFSASTVCVNGLATDFINNSTISTGNIVLFGWNFGDGNSSTLENPTHNYQIAASYNVTLGVVSDLGCVDSVTYSVDVLGKPSAAFTQDTTNGCAPLCVIFTDTSYDDIPIIEWNWKFENNYGESLQQTPSFCYTETGDYNVGLIVKNAQGCKDTLEQTALISIFPLPISDFTLTPNSTSVSNANIEFSNNSTNALNWIWNFADGTEPNVSDYNPSHNFEDTGHFEVELIAINSYLCSDTSYQTVEILPIDDLFVPSAFSPNGDGKNDILYARGYIGVIYFAVFDRLGKKVFESEDKEIGWNGIINGKNALEGVYNWYLQAEVNGKAYKLKGDVTLVR